MATTINASGVIYPTYRKQDRPTGQPTGTVIYNTDRKALEYYDGAEWQACGDEMPFLYRQVITKGYVLGGYKSSSPWTNVNRMQHSTDVMTDLGNLLQYAGSYVSGFCNLDSGFLFGCDGTWPGTSAQTSSFLMRAETTKTASTNHNMTVARNDSGCCFKEWYEGYIMGGGSTQIDRFSGITETMSAAIAGFTSSSAGSSSYQYGTSTISDENFSIFGDGAWTQKLVHNIHSVQANVETWGGGAMTSNGQQKGISSKLGKGWVGNEGTYNGGYNYRRWDLNTETNLGTVARPIGNTGEENYDMGQAHQYMHGMYDGAQNNRSQKFYYNTETGLELGSGSQRTGVPGGSSGACTWID